ncbi:WAP four-disulfide core domain protein 8-like [Suncus etruscus]|uniref:WAP four-disulfide core domain protein 8-like n=1 Tax=Suncus etruscus TaxID=109475 RepID=UPI00210F25D7|nr:WAP four-disulfide core domain protein 8-like [Suncus etruscus]
MIEKAYPQFCVIREMKEPHLNSLGECGQTSPATIPDKSCDPVMRGLSPRCQIMGELLGRRIYCTMAECGVTRMVLGLSAYSTFYVTVDNLLPLFSHFVKGVGGLSLRFLYRYFEFLWLGVILGPLLISGRYFPLQKTSFWKNIALLWLFLLFLEKTSANLSIKLRENPGVCPRERFHCTTEVQNLCYNDFDCKGHQKCCNFNCGLKCMDPDLEPCLLPVDLGCGTENKKRWYYDANDKSCKQFKYRGNHGNINNFFSQEDCEKACSLVFKEGQCPIFPVKKREICPDSCRSDYDCPLYKKCCETVCGFSCVIAWTVKEGYCPRKPTNCPKIDKPTCLQDVDCPLSEKCCSLCGLKCMNFRK